MKPGDRPFGGMFTRGRVIDTRPPGERPETIRIAVPSAINVLVYKSIQKPCWLSKVMIHAIDVETGERGMFGSEWEHPEKPTREKIREQIVDMLDHEVRHQLGMDPHGTEKKEPT